MNCIAPEWYFQLLVVEIKVSVLPIFRSQILSNCYFLVPCGCEPDQFLTRYSWIATLQASRANFHRALMMTIFSACWLLSISAWYYQRSCLYHCHHHLKDGIMPLPCLAPGMQTNSRSLPAVLSLWANLENIQNIPVFQFFHSTKTVEQITQHVHNNYHMVERTHILRLTQSLNLCLVRWSRQCNTSDVFLGCCREFISSIVWWDYRWAWKCRPFITQL